MSGPSSPISYRVQVAYYDPGLGAGEIDGVTPSKIKAGLEAAVGAGIEDNMIDCYAKIISYYEPGDRIILIGFSRGAYTVRALANMRSEEHTSELQSLMRLSYAVFCLKKKKILSTTLTNIIAH